MPLKAAVADGREHKAEYDAFLGESVDSYLDAMQAFNFDELLCDVM